MTKIKPPFVRNPYNYDTNEAGDESALECKDPTRAKQQFREEADINTIVRRFNITGQLPQNVRMPTYGDFTNVPTYHEAMNAIRAAQESFDAMPAEIRRRFNNDPGEFVDFCSNTENLEEARKMGLAAPAAADLAQTLPPGTEAPKSQKNPPAANPAPAPNGGQDT